MKVLFLCPSLAGAGVERRICTLLRELVRLGVDVRLALLRKEGEFLNEAPETRLVFIPPDPRLQKRLLAITGSRDFVNCVLGVSQIRRMLEETGPDIVVSFTLEATIPMYFVARRRSAKRFAWIISEDSNTAAATVEVCNSGLSASIVQSLLGTIYRKANHIVCVSRSVEVTVRDRYRVDRSRLSSLPNPVDIVRVKKATRKPIELQNHPDYILAVGRLVRIKQFDLLIRAFAELRNNRRFKLVILGEGPERAKLTRMAIDLGLADDIMFAGFVFNPWSFMAHAKLLVLTSKLEGFGNVIVEAMAAGCPIIATRCGGPEEIIQDGRNGILVEPNARAIANAMQLVLADSELSRRLVQNALADIENYTADKVSARFAATLKQVAMEQGL